MFEKAWRIIAVWLCFFVQSAAAAQLINVESNFVRSIGQPEVEYLTFPAVAGEGTLRISYDADDSFEKGCSALLFVNGAKAGPLVVFGKNKENVYIPVKLNEGDNELAVQMMGRPGGMIRVSVYQDVDGDGAAFIGPKGGVVEVNDSRSPLHGTRLEIPGGAVDELLLFKIHSRHDRGHSGETKLTFEPAGISFNTGVFLKIAVNPAFLFPHERYSVFSFAGASLSQDDEDEWINIEPLIAEMEGETVAVELNHISPIYLFKSRYFHVAFHIPPKYLTKGDILYRLSQSTFFPGHVGLYTGERNGEYAQIDSSAERFLACDDILRGTCPEEYSGVMETKFSAVWDFTLHYEETGVNASYMGARRPRKVSDDIRQNAVEYAESELGSPYQVIGGNSTGFSSVGLVEAAYESAGINMSWNEVILTPLQQFNNTVQVNKVNITPGELFEMGIYGLLDLNTELAEVSVVDNGNFTKDPDLFEIEIINIPSGASFEDNVFNWNPGCEDAWRTYRIGVNVAYKLDPAVSMNEDFFITVKGDGCSPETAEVHFPDANLESAVREEINKSAGPIYVDDVSDIHTLIANGRGIEDITGLGYLTGLQTVNLEQNNISDIDPISNLAGLRWLSLSNNEIVNIDGLSVLGNLTFLNAADNQIDDLKPLYDLYSLNNLWLGLNQIADINPIRGLSGLKTLVLSENQIGDISALGNLVNLEHLLLQSNQIGEIDSLDLENMTNLSSINLSGNQISDIGSLLSSYLFGEEDSVFIENNPLDSYSCEHVIQSLISTGVNVYHSCF